jgi:tetratricopeptide (TPR) repeat protein
LEELGITEGSQSELAHQLLQLAIELEEHNFLTTAEPMYRRAVAEYKALDAVERSPTSRVDRINSMIRFGRLLERLSKLDLAEAQLQAAFEAATSQADVGAAAMAAVAKSMDTLARTLLRMGRVQKAHALATTALAVNQQLHGNENHEDTANSLSVLGRIEERMGQLSVAAGYFNMALHIHKAIHGADSQHPDIANSQDSLGLVWQQQGRLKEAELLHWTALQIRLNSLGRRHHYTASSFDNLAKAYIKLGDLTAAEKLCDSGLAIRRETLGPEHPDVAMSLDTKAMLLAAQRGSKAEIERLRRQALRLVQAQRGPGALETAACMYNLGDVLLTQGKLVDAKAMFEQAQQTYEKALGWDSAAVEKCGRALQRVAWWKHLRRLCCRPV